MRFYFPFRDWSITTRLSVLYGLSAFATLVLAIGITYWSMLVNMGLADSKFINDKIHVLKTILVEHADDPVPLRQEVEWEKLPTNASPYYAYYSRIADASQRLVIQTPGFDTALAGAVFPQAVTADTNEIPVVRWRSKDGNAYLLASTWSRNGATKSSSQRIIQVALDVTQEDALLSKFRRQLALVLLLGFMLSTAIGNGVARRGMRPLAKIALTAERIRASSLNERIDPERWPTELKALAAAFDHMLARLGDSFTKLSQFSADLAHELRTPINNLMGEAEVTLSRPRTPDEYRQVLESSLEEYQRLSRMVESLLFLARADDSHLPVKAVQINVGKDIKEICEYHDSVAKDKGVTVDCDGEAMLWADPQLIRRAINNLLSNALHYTSAGGHISVTANQSDDGSVNIRVIDSGCGIPAKDLPLVFDRLYRGDDVRAIHPAGMGLGLAIVKSIMELHAGEASIDSEPGRGTTVTLHFPPRFRDIQTINPV
jgi:two-component system heavy metal sensor histidine kinase CusS